MILAMPFLAGCPGPLTRSVAESPAIAKVGASLKVPCADVVDIPDRNLSEKETSRLWAADRRSLGDCRRRHKGLVAAVNAIEGQGGK